MVCVDSGFQVGIGGAAGMDVKEVSPLIQIATEEETIAVVMAVTQLYREHAKYLDRIYKWMAKVGLEWIQEQIGDLETRHALVERFELSQTIYRKDPWAEHTKEAERFAPLSDLTPEAAE